MAAAGHPRVALLVLNYNGLEDTITCLESLKQINYPSLSTILVDNGSSIDPTEQALSTCPGLIVHKTGTNLGYAGGNNRGFELARSHGAEFVLVLNNDTVVDPGIVDELLNAFATDPTLGIVGPVVNFMEEPEVVMTDGVRFNPPGGEFFERQAIPIDPESSRPTITDIVNGCCLMIKSAVLDTVGYFDESFFIVHEESDLCLRADRAGFRCAVLGKSLVWHKGSSSFDRSGRQFQRYFDTRNLFFLLKRHAGHIRGSRTFPKTLWSYSRYVSYRYEAELEADKPGAARAVAEGLGDALLGRTGPYVARTRVLATGLQCVLSALRYLSRARRQLLSGQPLSS